MRSWVVNATVPMSYDRDDPDAHLAGLAAGLGLVGPGVGLLTGVDVAEVVARVDDGVHVWATVGLGAPIWAAADPPYGEDPDPSQEGEEGADPRRADAGRVGTVNIVAFLPARLTDAALVNAALTVTEAKAQALREMDLAATGTATDAVTVLCPIDGPPAPYGGPRSRWGAPLARAARAAVWDGGVVPRAPWSTRPAPDRPDRDHRASPTGTN